MRKKGLVYICQMPLEVHDKLVGTAASRNCPNETAPYATLG